MKVCSTSRDWREVSKARAEVRSIKKWQQSWEQTPLMLLSRPSISSPTSNHGEHKKVGTS